MATSGSIAPGTNLQQDSEKDPRCTVKLDHASSPGDDIAHSSNESLHLITESAEKRGQSQESQTVTKANPNIDRGYAWVIVFAAGLTFFLGGGFGKAYTMMYQQLLDKFDSSAKAAAWVGALFAGVKMCSSPVVSALLNKFGFRAVVFTGGLLSGLSFIWTSFPSSLITVYISYSVLGAFSNNMVHSSSMIIIGHYFDKRKGIAMALTLMCTSLGGVSIAPLMEFLYRFYGYSGAILIFSGLTFHYCISGVMMRRPPVFKVDDIFIDQSDGDEDCDLVVNKGCLQMKASTKLDNANVENELVLKHSEEQVSKKADENLQNTKCVSCGTKSNILNKYFGVQFLKNGEFMLYSIFITLAFVVFDSQNMFIGSLAKQNANMDDRMIAILLSVSSIFEFISRLLSGFLFDLKSIKQYRKIEVACPGILMGTLMIVTPLFAKCVYSFWALTITFQICACMLHTLYIPILSDIVGRESLTSATGIMRFFIGIGMLVGPVIGGALKDYTGSYTHAYILPGSALTVISVIFMTVMIYKRMHGREKSV